MRLANLQQARPQRNKNVIGGNDFIAILSSVTTGRYKHFSAFIEKNIYLIFTKRYWVRCTNQSFTIK